MRSYDTDVSHALGQQPQFLPIMGGAGATRAAIISQSQTLSRIVVGKRSVKMHYTYNVRYREREIERERATRVYRACGPTWHYCSLCTAAICLLARSRAEWNAAENWCELGVCVYVREREWGTGVTGWAECTRTRGERMV